MKASSSQRKGRNRRYGANRSGAAAEHWILGCETVLPIFLGSMPYLMGDVGEYVATAGTAFAVKISVPFRKLFPREANALRLGVTDHTMHVDVTGRVSDKSWDLFATSSPGFLGDRSSSLSMQAFFRTFYSLWTGPIHKA